MNQMKVEHIDHMGNDDSVVNAARVSFAKQADQYTDEQNARLIKYLAQHNHWTPFAHAFVTLRFKAPIAIHAHCVKHQIGFAMNTVSRRYVSDEPELFIPDFRLAPEGSVKQGSGDAHPDNGFLQEAYKSYCDKMIKFYIDMIDVKVAPEQARFVLPQGVMTEWVWSGSLQAWARFYNQRSDSHAQQEVQFLAREVDRIVGALFPVSWEALTDSTVAYPTTRTATLTVPQSRGYMKEQSSSVVSPNHYKANGVQCIDITRHMSFAKGNAVKYLWRAGKKDNNSEAQDIKKAMWYLTDELNRLGELSDAHMETIKSIVSE